MVSCNLSINGNIVTMIYTLPNTRAYRFLFMDTHCVIASTKFLGVPLRKLQDLITIKGYNSPIRDMRSQRLSGFTEELTLLTP